MIRFASALKNLRAAPSFNYLATAALRLATATVGVQSEFVIKHLPKVGLVTSRLPNGRALKLWSHGGDWVPNQVYWRGWRGYEPEASALFFRLAARARVTFDVGAHIGFYALLAGHANPASRVFAFEPAPETYLLLRRNVGLNRLLNVACVECAVSERDGTAEFYRPRKGIPCSAGLSFEFYRSWADDMLSIRVRTMTADRFAREQGLTCLDLIKIDTESTEPQVLRGMAELFRRNRPLIFCEVLRGCGVEELLEETLAPLGYRYYLLTGKGPAPRERIEGDPVWMNYLFTTLSPAEVVRL